MARYGYDQRGKASLGPEMRRSSQQPFAILGGDMTELHFDGRNMDARGVFLDTLVAVGRWRGVGPQPRIRWEGRSFVASNVLSGFVGSTDIMPGGDYDQARSVLESRDALGLLTASTYGAVASALLSAYFPKAVAVRG